jgi:endonuclease/exonuclease/phosphatase family metal-dependent hydrolase
VPPTTSLGWSATNATLYDVAFGTSSPPPVVVSGQIGTSYQPAALAASTTYYWQIVARNDAGATPGPVWSFTTAAPPTPSTPLRRLKVVTWNIQHGQDAGGVDAVDAQVAMLADLNADVIGLQEVSINTGRDLRAIYKAKLEAVTGTTWNTVWAPAPFPAGTNPEGDLILTRLPIASSSIAQFDAAPGDPTWLGSKRAAARVEVVVNQRSINVFITHVDTNVSTRSAQMSELLSWVDSFPAPRLIGGDFNLMPSESDYTTLSARYRDAWTLLVDANQATPGPDRGYTKNRREVAPWTGQPGRIDYWFVETTDTRAQPTEISVVETRRSDHNALVMWVDVR